MQQPIGREGSPTFTSAAQRPYPELSHRTILWSGVALLAIGASLVTVLLIAFGSGEHSSQLAAIKTAGTVVLGTGGAAALWLTARRQRSAEIALNQKRLDQMAVDRAFEENRRHQDRVATATEHDAAQRRLSDLYLKAVEQLGSDRAAVRHGGLYALERVAQNNPDQQQTVVNVLCAYLRAPYTAPGRSLGTRLGVRRPLLTSRPRRAAAVSSTSASPARPKIDQEAQQEGEVRLTALRILEKHLAPGPDRDRPLPTFWPDIDLDLTGAALGKLEFAGCCINRARFEGATFTGRAGFKGATFAEVAWFEGATFAGNARFDGATFIGSAGFIDVTFSENAWFEIATFTGDAWFEGAVFAEKAQFKGAAFCEDVWFGGATFSGIPDLVDVLFERATPVQFAVPLRQFPTEANGKEISASARHTTPKTFVSRERGR